MELFKLHSPFQATYRGRVTPGQNCICRVCENGLNRWKGKERKAVLSIHKALVLEGGKLIEQNRIKNKGVITCMQNFQD